MDFSTIYSLARVLRSSVAITYGNRHPTHSPLLTTSESNMSWQGHFRSKVEDRCTNEERQHTECHQHENVTNTKLEPYNLTLNRDQTPLEVVQVIENAIQVRRPSNKVSTVTLCAS